MKQTIKLGVTDRTFLVFIPDPASTDGSGKTGLNAAALTVSYARVETDNDVTITDVTSSLSDLSALTDAHSDWGLKEVSNTLAPGLYRLDAADAVFASGAWSAVIYVMITSSAAAASPMEFILVAYDPLDTVRLGLTALPNAAADAAGGLPISDAGGLDLDAQVVTKINDILTDTGTTLDGKINTIDGIVDDILVDTAVIGAAGAGLTEAGGTGDHLTAVPWNATWDAQVESEVTDALNAYDPPTKAELDSAVANVSVDEIQATALADLFNTDSGTTYASAVAGSVVAEIADNAGGASLTVQDIVDGVWDEAQASHVGAGTFGIIASEIADVLVDTAEIGAAGAGLTAINLPDQTMNITGNITGNLSGSVGSVTGLTASNLDATVSSRLATAGYTAPPTAIQNADALLDRNMATGTDSGGRTVRNALRFLRNKWSLSGGTLTVCKEDDTTSAWTSTIDSDPSSEPITGSDPA